MYWRRGGIRLLTYLDDFLFMAKGFWKCVRLARKLEVDIVRAGLRINVPKCHTLPSQLRRQLGFDVDFTDGKFRVRSTSGRRYARRQKALWERDTGGCKRGDFPTLLGQCFLCTSHVG